MSIYFADKNEMEPVEMRSVYAKTLINLAKENEKVVVLDADLMSSMGMTAFLEQFPDRTFNCGIQEANMIGVASGLSATGKIPYAHTFGPFASRRCLDQSYLSAAYAKLNVKIIGSDPGVTAAFNGGTHMPLEDMGIMRNIPGITIMEPTDSVMLENIIIQLSKLYGVHYVRLLRKNAIKIYEQNSVFPIGKGIKLKDGKDVTIIANGIMVAESLKAAKTLEGKGISATVVDMFTFKPIDKDIIFECAKKTGAIVTVENHNTLTGLASAVAGVLVEGTPVPLEKVGVNDEFGEVGPVDYLKKRFELTADDIVKKVEKVLKRK